MFDRYLKDYLMDSRVGMLQTPIMAEMKNGSPEKWVYDINKAKTLNGNSIKYFKGLGNWKKTWLQKVIKKDGFEKMVDIFNYDDQEIIDKWLNSKRADDRKEMILKNDFDLIKL